MKWWAIVIGQDSLGLARDVEMHEVRVLGGYDSSEQPWRDCNDTRLCKRTCTPSDMLLDRTTT